MQCGVDVIVLLDLFVLCLVLGLMENVFLEVVGVLSFGLLHI